MAEFIFPEDVEGWLLPAEGAALAELAQGKYVLEIGAYCGRSTICLAQTAHLVIVIDTFDGRATLDPKPTRALFEANIRRYGVDPKITALEGTASTQLRLVRRAHAWFDVIFIDGAHDVDSVRSDIAGALPLLSPGGVLAFHDYSTYHPGVFEAVNELLAAGAKLLTLTESLAVIEPTRT